MSDTQIGVLLPARLETRFVAPPGVNEHGQPGDRWRLKIAVIPDEPWMNRHSDVVSSGEADRLRSLWATLEDALRRREQPVTVDVLRQALRNSEEGRVAFRLLAQQVGAARAWWLATRFSPDDPPPTGQKACSRMDALPDQIEIWLGLPGDGGGITLQRLEPPMAIDKTALAFDAAAGAALNLFSDDRWWTKDAGLQAEYALPFADEAELGQIQVIIAVGLGAASPRELFEGHRNAGFLSLLPLGAPTNTVSGEPAADLAQDPDLWWRLLSEAGETGTREHLALALAGDRVALGAVPGGTRRHAERNQNLVRLVWPALWGHTLKDVWCIDLHEHHWRGLSYEIGEWAQHWLYPEGPLAPIRVGDQPYGLWPVTRLADGAWQAAAGDPLVEHAWLARWLPTTRRHWAESVRSSGNIAGANTDRFVQLLGRTPSASAYGYRTFMPLQVMYLLSGALLGGVSPAEDWRNFAEGLITNSSENLDFPVQPIRHYMASGALEDLALPLVEPPRVTHLSGTNSGGLLFYDASIGEGASASIDPARGYRFGAVISGFTREWNNITPYGEEFVLFYKRENGVAALSRVDGAGRYEFISAVQSVKADWTHVAATAAGGVLFYRAGTRRGQVGRIDGAGVYRVVRNFTDLHRGWTHIVAANQSGLLFYDATSGITATSTLNGDGTYQFRGAVAGIAAGWTHVVGTSGGGVLYYNAVTGEGLSAWLDGAGRHHLAGPVPGLGAGWTHVAGSGSDGLLLYNAATGAAATARLDGAGAFQFTGAVVEALQDGRSVFFEQVERIFEVDDEHGVSRLFTSHSDFCDPLLETDSLLMRLILNSIALLQAEFGRMKRTRDFASLPLIDSFLRDGYCSEVQMWCEEAQDLRLQDISLICDLLGLGAGECAQVEQWPIVQLHQNLHWTLIQWRDEYRQAREQVRQGHPGAVRQVLNDIERAFRATLDTAALRIDPWITGMAARRLTKLREKGVSDGLGLYAWVDTPYRGSPGPTDGGTLLAPSHAQLLTSVILRDKQINDFQADRWKIELDSRTVRLAKQFADEVRAGAHIQEVLGRSVEGVVGRNDQIRLMRMEFPIRVEHAGRRVCDGQKVLSQEGRAFLDGLNLSSGQQTALEELREVVNTYGDLLVANAVHSLVSGQPEKAGETMDAAAGLELPPEFDLLRTPHGGHSVVTTVWLALPSVPQPDVDELDASPALLADAAVAMFLEQSVPLEQWTWSFAGEAGEIDVTLADLGLRVAEAMGYSEDALRQLAAQHAAGGAVVALAIAGEPLAAQAHRQVRRLAALLAGHVADGHSVPDENQQRIAQWEEHDAELRARFGRLLVAAQALHAALDPEAGDVTALRQARRWGIAPARLDDSLAPLEHQMSEEEQVMRQLAQAQATLDDRIRRAEGMGDEPAIHQIAQALAELSGTAMPIFGRATQAMLEDFGALQPHPNLDREWLETVAAVRPALARVEARQLGAETHWNAWCNHADPWTFVQPEAGAQVKQAMHVTVCYSPSPTLGDPGASLAVAVLDSWSEIVPEKRHIVEAAFGFNAPSSRAPQAILLAVPPDEARPLDTETLAHIVLEARESAHARMAVAEDISSYAALFPFSMTPAQQPTGVSLSPAGVR